MSRRRRKGNPLLARILMISVAAHIVVLPILARFGAFDRIKREFVTANVTVAPPPAEHDKPPERKAPAKKAVPKAKATAKTGKPAQNHSAAPHPNVVASNAPSNGNDAEGGATVDPGGTGKVGLPPKEGSIAAKPEGEGATGSSASPPKDSRPEPTELPPKPAPTPNPSREAPPEPKPEPVVLVAAEPTVQPMPEVPDDLRSEAVDKTCVVSITVTAEGTSDETRVETSSGSPELDTLATSTARRWKFRPATKNGSPIPSRVRLHVRFKVD